MKLIWGLLWMLCIVGCGAPPENSGKIRVVCTTGMVADAASSLLADRAVIKTLMGPGVDPHLYKATQGDIEALTSADLIVYNGLHLEGKMAEIFQKLSRTKTVIALGELLPEDRLINSTNYADAYDPHIWFDVYLWSIAVQKLADELEKQFPESAAIINQNAAHYADTLFALDQFVRKEIGQIPKSQRVLITAHDAFKYFGQAYGMEVKGLQGISTSSEYGLRDISDLVNYVVDHNIKAIFVESSVPKRSVEAVIEGASERGHKLMLGGQLFSDAMGRMGTPEGTYPGMVRYNVNTIVKALK